MRIQQLICEKRSHPEQNPRETTAELIARFAQQDNGLGLYVHFGSIEKVGINPRSQNIYGPIGVYAIPLLWANDHQNYWRSQVDMTTSKYVNIIQLKPSARVLDLSTIYPTTMKDMLEKTIRWHKKKTGTRSDYYQHMRLHNSVANLYRDIEQLVTDYAKRRKKTPMYQLNHWFRTLGYDAVLDDGNQIINDNPSQIVFLTPSSYHVIYRAPVTLNKGMNYEHT